MAIQSWQLKMWSLKVGDRKHVVTKIFGDNSYGDQKSSDRIPMVVENLTIESCGDYIPMAIKILVTKFLSQQKGISIATNFMTIKTRPRLTLH